VRPLRDPLLARGHLRVHRQGAELMATRGQPRVLLHAIEPAEFGHRSPHQHPEGVSLRARVDVGSLHASGAEPQVLHLLEDMVHIRSLHRIFGVEVHLRSDASAERLSTSGVVAARLRLLGSHRFVHPFDVFGRQRRERHAVESHLVVLRLGLHDIAVLPVLLVPLPCDECGRTGRRCA